MTQVSILSGITGESGVDIKASYPINLVPVPRQSGVSAGYLRTAEGISRFDNGNPAITGRGRASIFWNGVAYWVIGEQLCSIQSTGVIEPIGYVGDDGLDAQMTYSFDRLAIASARSLYYLKGGLLSKVTDLDLGPVISLEWMDGYFVTTDGISIVVTELNDPNKVDPLKYGSSEADPDPVKRVIKIRQELLAVNRNTIEVFSDVGGAGFPFARNNGAIIEKGAVGTHMACAFDQVLAFVGGGKNEPCSVYLGSGGNATKVATREIEDILATYTEEELAVGTAEYRMHRKHQSLIIGLARHTLVYDAAASIAMETPVWYQLSSSTDFTKPLQGRHFLFAYNRWLMDDLVEPRIGELRPDIFTQYDVEVGWRFDTVLVFNETKSAIVSSLELTGTPGRAEVGTDPVCFLSWTQDGATWGDERMIKLGKSGQRAKRIAYRPKIKFRDFMSFRYRGANAAIVSFMRLDAELEGLANG